MFNLKIRNMKRILTVTLVLALTAFIFSSCSKDKKENEELKTLEGTEWGTNGEFTDTDGSKHQVKLNFIDGKSFTLSHIVDNGPVGPITHTFTGDYVYEKPNITLNALDLNDRPYTFKGTIEGKTMTIKLSRTFVLNMQ